MSMLEYKLSIQKMGTSHGIVLPKAWLKAQKLNKGDKVIAKVHVDFLTIEREK